MVDDELDPLIDEVAREMTSAPPRDGLARRVSMRIAAGDRGDDIRSAVRLPQPWVLVPVASACVVLLAVFVARQGSVRLKPDATTVSAPPVASGFSRTGDVAPRAGGPERAALQTVERVARPTPRELPELPPETIPPIAVDRLEI